MTTILPAVHTSTPIRSSLSSQGSDPTTHFFFGRSVNDSKDKNGGTVRRADKELTQGELNQKHPQNLEWQSHCQFYADCADCQRVKQQPDDPVKLPQSRSGEKPEKNDKGCQRIKPAEVLANQPDGGHMRIVER